MNPDCRKPPRRGKTLFLFFLFSLQTTTHIATNPRPNHTPKQHSPAPAPGGGVDHALRSTRFEHLRRRRVPTGIPRHRTNARRPGDCIEFSIEPRRGTPRVTATTSRALADRSSPVHFRPPTTNRRPPLGPSTLTTYYPSDHEPRCRAATTTRQPNHSLSGVARNGTARRPDQHTRPSACDARPRPSRGKPTPPRTDRREQPTRRRTNNAARTERPNCNDPGHIFAPPLISHPSQTSADPTVTPRPLSKSIGSVASQRSAETRRPAPTPTADSTQQ